MKKRIILLGALVFCLAIIGSVSAQQTGSVASASTTPVFSANQNLPPNVAIEPVVKETDLSNIDKQQKLDKVISKGLTLINIRVDSLKALAKRINKDPKLNDEQKNNLAAVNSQIDSLQALVTKLKADTDINVAKADVKSIYTDYRIYGVFIPKINLIQKIEVEQNFFNNLSTQFTQTQARIDQEQASSTNCKNIAAKQKALDDAKAAAAGIDATLASALGKVSALVPADYSATSTRVVNETNKITKGVRAKFVSIRILLIKANAKAVSLCTKTQICTNNQCVDKCPDHTCSRVGQKGCTDSGQVWTCAKNELGCIVPKNSTCAEGKVCQAGKCAVPACTAFTYTDWTTCSAKGNQSRKVASSSPVGCAGGKPILTQKCTYVPICQNACDPVTYGTKCTASRANGYTECVKKADGCYYAAEKICPLGQTCSEGKCAVQCLAQGRNGSNLLAACCADLVKKTDYYVNTSYLYTCCLPTQCAKNGVCADNGSTISIAGSALVPTCVDGKWVRKAISQ
jgi:hypothetical protein